MKQEKIDQLIELVKDFEDFEYSNLSYLVGDYKIFPNLVIDGFRDGEPLLISNGGLVFDLSDEIVKIYNKTTDVSVNLFGSLLKSDDVYANLINAIDELKTCVKFSFHSDSQLWVNKYYSYSLSNKEMIDMVSFAKHHDLKHDYPEFETRYNGNKEILCTTITGDYVVYNPTIDFFKFMQSLIGKE